MKFYPYYYTQNEISVFYNYSNSSGYLFSNINTKGHEYTFICVVPDAMYHEGDLFWISEEEFVCSFRADTCANSDLYMYNTISEDYHKLLIDTSHHNYLLDYNEKDNSILFSSFDIDSSFLNTMNVDGSNLKRLLKSDRNGNAIYSKATWSPNNDKIGYRRNIDAFVMDNDGNNIIKLNNKITNTGLGTMVRWSTNDEIIFVTSEEDGAGNRDSYYNIVNSEGRNLRRIKTSAINIWGSSFFPTSMPIE